MSGMNLACVLVCRVLRVFFPVLLVAGCARHVADIPADDALEQGWVFFRLGDFTDAERLFGVARNHAGEASEQYYEALYALGVNAALRRPGEDRGLAAELFEQVVEGAGKSELGAWAALALARLVHLTPVGVEPDMDAVRRAYRRVMTEYAGMVPSEEATIYYYATYMASMQPDEIREAVRALREFTASHPESGFLSAAYALQAFGYDLLGMQSEQMAALLLAFEMREVDSENPFYDNSWRYWNLAASAEFVAGDFDLARKFYRLLIEEYPQDVRTYSSRRALERMERVEAGLLEEIRREEEP